MKTVVRALLLVTILTLAAGCDSKKEVAAGGGAGAGGGGKPTLSATRDSAPPRADGASGGASGVTGGGARDTSPPPLTGRPDSSPPSGPMKPSTGGGSTARPASPDGKPAGKPGGGAPISGEAILKQLESLPVGIKVVHVPPKVKARKNPGTLEHVAKNWSYYWGYETRVSTMEKPVTIIAFGSCEWVDGKWAIPSNPEEYDVILGTGQQFNEWYLCTQAKLEPGQEYVDNRNWSGSKTLRSFKQKWFYIGVDKDGKRVKGEAEVELLGELDSGAGSK
jgi:hypothetical protein